MALMALFQLVVALNLLRTFLLDVCRQKEALRRGHDKALDALKQQYETQQEGWRAAMAERARRELADKEAALRDKLRRERDQEIEVI